MRMLSIIAAALALLPAAGPAGADSLRCNGHVVNTGDRMFQVRERCGEPDVKVVKNALHGGHAGYLPHEEQWQYNLGPQKQMRFLDFVDKELRRITTGPHGFTSPAERCDPGELKTGISKLELLGRCGEPELKEERVIRQAFRLYPDGPLYQEGTPATDWIYRFGDNRFTRIVTLINGRVVRVEETDKPD